MSRRQWIALFVSPLLLNLFLWSCIFLPLQKRLSSLQSARASVEVKPSLETSLKESDLILKALNQGQASFSGEDPSVVTEAFQQLVTRHHLLMADLKTGSPGGRGIPLEAELSGSFNKLARWISDLEADPRFQMDSWNFKAGAPHEPTVLRVKLTAFTQGGI